MFLLSRQIENSFTFKGKVIVLNLAFDHVLRVFELWKEELFSVENKIALSLDLLIINRRQLRHLNLLDRNELLKIIFERFITISSKSTGSEEKSFDFNQDAGYIFASFLMDYNIDLVREQGALHWQQFIALFQGLSERTKIREVMRIRTRKLPEPTPHNRDEIRALMAMKALYALEVSQAEQARQFERSLDKLADALEKRAEA